MTKLRTYLAGIALASVATAAYADLSFTPALGSDYDFRGITQTANGAALSLGVDYTTGPVHLGLWTSNINFDPFVDTSKFFDSKAFFGSGHQEVDFIADYSGGDDKTFKYNFGFVDYTYPGQSILDYPEIWGTISKDWFSASLHYSWDFFGGSYPASSNSSAYYVEVNGTWALGNAGFGLTAHAGHSWGDFWDNPAQFYAASPAGPYSDYAIGVTKSFGHFNTVLKYIDTTSYYDSGGYDKKQTKGYANEDVFSGKGKVLFSISTTLPWAPPGK
jgi:uncharacterized protein (TIGR02001 family)